MGWRPLHGFPDLAVFLALAVGILIGAEFSGDALTEHAGNTEQASTSSLQDARSRLDDLSGELGRANEFDEKVTEVLTRERLLGKRIAVVAMGGLAEQEILAVKDALGPTGATHLVGVGVVREPVEMNGLASELSETRFAEIPPRRSEEQAELGVGVGRQIVIGGTLPGTGTRPALLAGEAENSARSTR